MHKLLVDYLRIYSTFLMETFLEDYLFAKSTHQQPYICIKIFTLDYFTVEQQSKIYIHALLSENNNKKKNL